MNQLTEFSLSHASPADAIYRIARHRRRPITQRLRGCLHGRPPPPMTSPLTPLHLCLLAALRILGFQPSGSLPDYNLESASACDVAYAAFFELTSHAATLDTTTFLIVMSDNVLHLYACEDSSLCHARCDNVTTCGSSKARCCYPLSDGSVWKPRNELGVFPDFGCRGFSSWFKNRTTVARVGASRLSGPCRGTAPWQNVPMVHHGSAGVLFPSLPRLRATRSERCRVMETRVHRRPARWSVRRLGKPSILGKLRVNLGNWLQGGSSSAPGPESRH
jgi:hypothetical protein